MSLAAPPPEVIRMTTENPYRDRLPAPMGTSEKRSPLCGSRVIVDINLDEHGQVSEVGMRVNACAFGQAAATILARNLIGRTPEELDLIRESMAQWMIEELDQPQWPDIEHLRPERLNNVRKGSVQLAFQAAAEAAATAAASAAAERDADATTGSR